MTDKKYDVAVYIGRFQPFHNGHKYVVEQAKKIAHNVVILVGSASSSRSQSNPFTFNERQSIIHRVVPEVDYILPLADFLYEENQWLTEVQELVDTAIEDNPNSRVCIIGHTKDESSYYIKSFPQWDVVELEHWEKVSGTDIRDHFFGGKPLLYLKSIVPEDTYEFLNWFGTTEHCFRLVEEYQAIKAYKESWAGSPFPPTFATVDAVVIQSGHILLVKRGEHPGKGLWAVPGGFLNQTETQKAAAIRELREETKLKVPVKVLEGSIKKEHTFASIGRSSRGRTITQAFLFQLDNTLELPKVKGSDDAVYAKWFPLLEFYNMEEEMFEDHYHMVRYMIDNS